MFSRWMVGNGEGGIRTHATVTRPNAFRVRPLTTTWVLLHDMLFRTKFIIQIFLLFVYISFIYINSLQFYGYYPAMLPDIIYSQRSISIIWSNRIISPSPSSLVN